LVIAARPAVHLGTRALESSEIQLIVERCVDAVNALPDGSGKSREQAHHR
jgi:hypothetical protein